MNTTRKSPVELPATASPPDVGTSEARDLSADPLQRTLAWVTRTLLGGAIASYMLPFVTVTVVTVIFVAVPSGCTGDTSQRTNEPRKVNIEQASATGFDLVIGGSPDVSDSGRTTDASLRQDNVRTASRLIDNGATYAQIALGFVLLSLVASFVPWRRRRWLVVVFALASAGTMFGLTANTDPGGQGSTGLAAGSALALICLLGAAGMAPFALRRSRAAP